MVVIDGAHAPGMVPLDLGDIGADFYGANCHKWLMAPAGAGFLHVDPRHKAMIEPLITSWGWEFDRDKLNDDSGWGGNFWQRNFEFNGTLDRTPQMAIAEALDFARRWEGTTRSSTGTATWTLRARPHRRLRFRNGNSRKPRALRLHPILRLPLRRSDPHSRCDVLRPPHRMPGDDRQWPDVSAGELLVVQHDTGDRSACGGGGAVAPGKMIGKP
jgi:hypothetical protein